MRPRTVILCVVALLCTHLALLLHAALRNSATVDEGPHLAAGMAYLRYGEMSIYNLSPPLVRMIAALPGYLAGAEVPPAKSFRDEPAGRRFVQYYRAFEPLNVPRLHRYVVMGRLALFPFSLVVALMVFRLGRALYSNAAGLLACATWCFSPTVIAHASLIGTDIASGAGMLAAVWLWARFLRSGKPLDLLGAAFAVGLTHAMKFTALLLWPMLVAIAVIELIHRRREPLAGRSLWRELTAGFSIVAAVTFVLLNGAYGFRLMGDPLSNFRFTSATMRAAQELIPAATPVPFHRDMVRGFDAQKEEAESLYATVLFDQAYFGADWRYYPWLTLGKTTVGGLALLAMALASVFILRPRWDESPLLVLSAGVVIGMVALAQINISNRYLLPAYAPACILIARVMTLGRLWRAAALAALLLLVVESVVASPRQLAFRNVAARWLGADVPASDSGQSLLELREWMHANSPGGICLLYFGYTSPRVYGIDGQDPYATPTPAEYIAIGRRLLEGIPIRVPQGFAFVRPWRELRKLTPAADFGGIVVYRRVDVEAAMGGRPGHWAVPVHDWRQVIDGEPDVLVPVNFEDRLKRGG